MNYFTKVKSRLPFEAEAFIRYFKSIKELHQVCITSKFNQFDYKSVLFDFEQNFYFLYEHFNLNMTLKIHIIVHRYEHHFKNMGENFKETNGESVETVHSSIKKHEEKKGFVNKIKLGTTHHLKRAHQSISSFNALKMGSTPPRDIVI